MTASLPPEQALLERQVQLINRFPDQNPNPVLRMADDGLLTYANESSLPVRRALGVEVGEQLHSEMVERLSAAAESGGRVEVTHDHRTFALLPVAVPEFGFVNIYGTDVTGERVVERFPNRNPNPVFRIDDSARLLYANAASGPLIEAFGLLVGDRWPDEVAERMLAAADAGSDELLELEANLRTYALRAVRIPELDFINVYGMDVTAQQVIAKFPAENPNPVLRIDREGVLLYANDASRHIVDSLGLIVGEPLAADLAAPIFERLEEGRRSPLEITAGRLTYELLPVPIDEFGFINLYGTDVTAAREVARAREESERLLLNILPSSIADRLRAGERVIADRFEDATLMIADIVGFTELSSGMSADRLVELLNEVFSVCDVLVERHGLEKVKTIGDAYMVVGGVPLAMPDHVQRVADFALDMATAVDALQEGLPTPVGFRIGISRGPLVAGVIGSKRTIYDVWGDTVNMASRMEMLGLPGRIQVTQEVYDRLSDAYEFEPRGMIEVKGKGALATYFLTGRR